MNTFNSTNSSDTKYLSDIFHSVHNSIPYFSEADLLHFFLPLAQRILALIQNPAMHNKPCLVGISGSVSSGKSTFAATLKELISKFTPNLNAYVISTDGFLYTNDILNKKNIMNQKGFPCSYDYERLKTFIESISNKEGCEHLTIPVYSHSTYDVCINSNQFVKYPDLVIFEGVNVLQNTQAFSLVPYLDISLYVDAKNDDLFEWFKTRFNNLLNQARNDPSSMFKNYLAMSPEEIDNLIREVWFGINYKNLIEHILPSKTNAEYIVQLKSDHSIENIFSQVRQNT